MKYILCLIIWFLASCASPPRPDTADDPIRWYKGNLHTHSYWSDGDEFPEMIMDWYRKEGYQFVALSDHNVLAKGEYWKEIAEDSIYQDGFKSYLQHYGSPWVRYKEDSGKIQVRLKTLEEYRNIFEKEGEFLILQSEEITDRFENKPIHLNATNVRELIDPQGGSSVVEVLQNNINAVLRQSEEKGQPMLVHINHPNYGFAITLEDLIALQGEQFFELFNGHPQVFNFGDSLHMDTETMWDQINIAYLKKGQPLLYGLATDDSHHYHDKSSQLSNSGRGWIQVQSDTLTVEALISAIESGHFYASTGITLKRVDLNNNILSVEVEPEAGAEYQIQFIGCENNAPQTRVLQTISGNKASFSMHSGLQFVRAKVTSNKPPSNPIENMKFQTAWTQPVVYSE